MKLILRITGIAEEQDYNREAEVDEALSKIPTPHTKQMVESLYALIPLRHFVMLDVRVKNESGKEIGSLAMREEEWPKNVCVGDEIEFVDTGDW